jgi:hypothetical protein
VHEVATGGPRLIYQIGEREVVIKPLSYAQIERLDESVQEMVAQALEMRGVAEQVNFENSNQTAAFIVRAVCGIGVRGVGRLLRSLYKLTDEDMEELDLVTASDLIKRQLEITQIPEVIANVKGLGAVLSKLGLRLPTNLAGASSPPSTSSPASTS